MDLVKAKSFIESDVILASDPDFAAKTATKKNQLAWIDILMVILINFSRHFWRYSLF